MRKKTSIQIVAAVTLLAMAFASCTVIDTALIGKWSYSILTVETSYEFKTSGDFTITVAGIAGNYKYEATGGSGKYWVDGDPADSADFTYEIDGDTLLFTQGGATIEMTKAN